MEKTVLIIENYVGLTRYYHTTFIIAAKEGAGYSFADTPSLERLTNEFGPDGAQLYNAAQHITGVAGVRLSRYQLTISIYPAFDWDEIEEMVLKEMEGLYGSFVIRRRNPVYRAALWLRRNVVAPLLKGISS